MITEKGKIRLYVTKDKKKHYLAFRDGNRFDLRIAWGETFQLKGIDQIFHVSEVIAEPVTEGVSRIIIMAIIGMLIHPIAVVFFAMGAYLITKEQQNKNQHQANYFNQNKL